MFLGQFEHAIDDKGRTTIPARFRELLEDGAYITQGFDPNLIVYPASVFTKISQQINHLSITDPSARRLKRLIFANAVRVEFDRAGRILIPQFLRDRAGLADQAVIVGSGTYIEIWSAENWENQVVDMQNQESGIEQYAALNLTLD
jgi:MraZ protein